MKNELLSINIPVSSVSKFDATFVNEFLVKCPTSTLKVVDRVTPVYDYLGDEYVIYTFSADNVSEFFMLGRVIGLYL